MQATQIIVKTLNVRDARKTLKTGENEKRKAEEKFNNVTSTIKFFYFIFCIWKRIYFARKHSLGICVLYYCISGKVSFSVAGYLKDVMKHQRPYTSALVLKMSYFDPKYLPVDQVF